MPYSSPSFLGAHAFSHPRQPTIWRCPTCSPTSSSTRRRLITRFLLDDQNQHYGTTVAVLHYGISGRTIDQCWTLAWLRALQTTLPRDAHPHPDFLIPAISDIDTTEMPTFQRPMSYTQAISLLRHFLQTPWQSAMLTPTECTAFTLHSLKTCLLSSAHQLRIDPEARRKQGHHKIDSVALYSRDDTVDSLFLQREVALQLRLGWRPTRPLARGGQAPTIEPTFALSPQPQPDHIRLNHIQPPLPLFTYMREQTHQAPSPTSPPSDISDPEAWEVEQTIQSSSDSEIVATTPRSEPNLKHLVQTAPWGCMHVAWTSTPEDDPHRTACGVPLTNFTLIHQTIGQHPLCQRKACIQAFDNTSGAPSSAD